VVGLGAGAVCTWGALGARWVRAAEPAAARGALEPVGLEPPLVLLGGSAGVMWWRLTTTTVGGGGAEVTVGCDSVTGWVGGSGAAVAELG
jgi:hypothetical protein